MLRRRGSSFALPVSLVASMLATTLAHAQGTQGPAASTAPSPPQVTAPGRDAARQGPDAPPISDVPSAAPPGAAPAPTPAHASYPASPAAVPPSPSPTVAPSPLTTIDPAKDQQALAAQGAQRPAGDLAGASDHEVFSEDWWGRARPVVEMHGYFRTRAALFHNFFLGRHSSYVAYQAGGNGVGAVDPQGQYLWPIPLDQSYTDASGTAHNVALCGTNATPNQNCYDKTQSGANLRLRLDPEIHISDNLRILTQVDLLDNVVLGSTPNSQAEQPASGAGGAGSGMGSGGAGVKYPTGYQSAGFNAYAPIGFSSTTQGPPTAGVNGWTNSINVRRIWGEYMTPVGQLRFGRMPDQWGLGMVSNAGDGIDSDYQSTVDRIMFVSGLKSMDLYFGAGWDFPDSGPTTASPYSVYGGQPYNTCNLCNVNEWVAFLAHKTNPEIQKLKLSKGDIIINGGVYTTFRSQYLGLTPGATSYTTDYANTLDNGLEPRQAWAVVPDGWVQALWRKFRFEAEFATIQGQLGYVSGYSTNVNSAVALRQYGLTTQTELRAIDDKLDLQFGFGWASGDRNANNAGTGALQPPPTGIQGEYGQGGQLSPMSTFRFNPDYRVDLIFYRNILSRIAGSYYFRPSADYDFVRHPDGEKLGGGAAVIWSRASEFVQTPGHKRDLGVELDLQLYYQSKDGSLNDDPTKIGGFFAMLQYGVFFPLGGLDYLPGEVNQSANLDVSLSAAQMVRLFLGIGF